MPLFKVNRHLALVGIVFILLLWFSMAPREVAIAHQELEDDKELFNGHDNTASYAQYRAAGRVASDVYVNLDRGLVPETVITSHVPGSSLQRFLRPQPTDIWSPGFTVIRSLLVANGTFLIVSDHPNRLPELQFVLSAWNDANGELPSSSIPSQNEIRVISRKAVAQLMGTSASFVTGTTWIYNEPYVCMCPEVCRRSEISL